MKTLSNSLLTIFLLTIGVIISFYSCRKEPPVEYPLAPCDCPNLLSTSNIDTAKANIRIKNNTPFDLCGLTFDPTAALSNPDPTNDYYYGNIAPQKYTDYISFDLAYKYGWIRATINGQNYYLQPYDYFGETPLASGKYIYEISWNNEYVGDTLKSISLKFIIE